MIFFLHARGIVGPTTSAAYLTCSRHHVRVIGVRGMITRELNTTPPHFESIFATLSMILLIIFFGV